MPGHRNRPLLRSNLTLLASLLVAGQVIGLVDARGAEPTDRTVSAQDFLATLCRILGIDYTREYETREGRPRSFLRRSARPIAELI